MIVLTIWFKLILLSAAGLLLFVILSLACGNGIPATCTKIHEFDFSDVIDYIGEESA